MGRPVTDEMVGDVRRINMLPGSVGEASEDIIRHAGLLATGLMDREQAIDGIIEAWRKMRRLTHMSLTAIEDEHDRMMRETALNRRYNPRSIQSGRRGQAAIVVLMATAMLWWVLGLAIIIHVHYDRDAREWHYANDDDLDAQPDPIDNNAGLYW